MNEDTFRKCFDCQRSEHLCPACMNNKELIERLLKFRDAVSEVLKRAEIE